MSSRDWEREAAPDGLPIRELGDPDAAFEFSLYGGGYLIVRPPGVSGEGEEEQ
jgi:hypothetical protein